ncbi:MAG: hypothetical protein H7Y11_07630 [Armatimonadetes bacterium]|nr:hypothetical protein [Anaerolineae bacterium]
MKTHTPRWLLNAALMLFGTLTAVILLFGMFALFPQLRPGITLFTVAQGDIFYHQAAWITPPTNPQTVLAMYYIGWDEDGFRIPAWQAESYPILAVGDSFTEAPNVGRPWTDVLATIAQQPVRNLAYRGFGPIEEAQALLQYGTDTGAQTVVIGFFEGNDLGNAVTSQDTPGKMPADLTTQDRAVIATDLGSITERDERYPMTVTLNGVGQPMAFFEAYVWALNASVTDFTQSRDMQLTLDAYTTMRAAVPEACTVVAYFPTSAHIYLPYLAADDQAILLQKTERRQSEPGKRLKNMPAPEQTFSELLANLPNQRDAVQAQMTAAGFAFFDLTPVLHTAAARGELLYYTYDTHWNQAGHDVVGAAIAEYLATDPCGQRLTSGDAP